MLNKIKFQGTGEDLVEYGMLTGLIAIAVALGVSLVGANTGRFLTWAASRYAQIYPSLSSATSLSPGFYGPLLLPIMVGLTGLGVGVCYLLLKKAVDGKGL